MASTRTTSAALAGSTGAVSGIVDQRASRHGNVQDLVGSTLDGAAEANQGHLVGAPLASTASQLHRATSAC